MKKLFVQMLDILVYMGIMLFVMIIISLIGRAFDIHLLVLGVAIVLVLLIGMIIIMFKYRSRRIDED